MTLTGAERCGSGPNCTGAIPSKKSSSSTVEREVALDAYGQHLGHVLASLPRFLSFTCV